MSVKTDFWKGVPGGVDSDDSGRFVRRDSIFRRWVSTDAGAEFPAEPGRYHLYVSLGCPWANRTVTVRALKGLEEVVGLSVVDPIRDSKGWAFREAPGATGDPINGFEYLSEAYQRSYPGYDDRYSVPVLWDRATGQIINNESSEIIVMLDGAFNEWAEHPEVDLYPAHLRAEIDAVTSGSTAVSTMASTARASPHRRRPMTRPSGRCSRRSTAWTRSSRGAGTSPARSTRWPTGGRSPR